MKQTITAVTLASVLFTGSALSASVQAQQATEEKTIIEHIEDIPQQEKIGVSIGAVIGGIFGGPPGAFITAIAGDFIAKHIIAEEEIATLENELASKEVTAKNAEHRYQGEMKNMQMQYQQEVLNIAKAYENSEKAQVENILVSLMFRTGSSTIEPHYKQQIKALSIVLARSPHLNINLQGYTDKQGDEQLNLKLAQERVASVTKLLVDEGIDETRIVGDAIGESMPVNAAIASEVNYFDRRVDLKLTVDSEEVAKHAKL